MRLSVAIPVYNEEESLAPLLQCVRSDLYFLRILNDLVNDGSRDSSLEFLAPEAYR